MRCDRCYIHHLCPIFALALHIIMSLKLFSLPDEILSRIFTQLVSAHPVSIDRYRDAFSLAITNTHLLKFFPAVLTDVTLDSNVHIPARSRDHIIFLLRLSAASLRVFNVGNRLDTHLLLDDVWRSCPNIEQLHIGSGYNDGSSSMEQYEQAVLQIMRMYDLQVIDIRGGNTRVLTKLERGTMSYLRDLRLTSISLSDIYLIQGILLTNTNLNNLELQLCIGRCAWFEFDDEDDVVCVVIDLIDTLHAAILPCLKSLTFAFLECDYLVYDTTKAARHAIALHQAPKNGTLRQFTLSVQDPALFEASLKLASKTAPDSDIFLHVDRYRFKTNPTLRLLEVAVVKSWFEGGPIPDLTHVTTLHIRFVRDCCYVQSGLADKLLEELQKATKLQKVVVDTNTWGRRLLLHYKFIDMVVRHKKIETLVLPTQFIRWCSDYCPESKPNWNIQRVLVEKQNHLSPMTCLTIAKGFKKMIMLLELSNVSYIYYHGTSAMPKKNDKRLYDECKEAIGVIERWRGDAYTVAAQLRQWMKVCGSEA